MSNRQERASLTVQGWIRENLKIEIPIDIMDLCILFYLQRMVFYTQKHGDNLEFSYDGLSVTSKEDGDRTCLFGDYIDAKECDKFEIWFKWLEDSSESKAWQKCLLMGYIRSTIEKSILDWNQGVGLDNYEHSKGIFTGYDYDKFYVSENAELSHFGEYFTRKPREEDEFRLTFDFESDELNIWFDGMKDDKGESIELEGAQRIYPALTLCYSGQSIQVIKWMFYKGDKSWT